MALLITPIDMVEVCRNNPELPLDTMLLYKPYEVPDQGMEYFNTQPIAGQVTIGDNTYRIHFGSRPHLRGFRVSRIITVPHPDPVVNKWGDWHIRHLGHKDDGLYDWVFKKIGSILANRVDIPRNHDGEDFVLRLKLFNPMRSAIAFGKISVYQSRKDYDNDRQVAMKPGRALKMMFDTVDDATILEWVDEYLDTFAPREYNLHVSKEGSDFTKAYTGKQVATQNISHSHDRKSLANSCMRYHFKEGHGPRNLPIHPVEAYASGDFSIAWVDDKGGLIGGRVVLYHQLRDDVERVQAGPIYGACDVAVRQLEDYIESIGGEFAGEGDWSGARLVAHKYEDGFIAPYLDIEPRSLSISPDQKHIIIDFDGNLDANSYQGILSDGGDRCYSCEDRIHEGDDHYSEQTGENYCPDCYYEDHFHCDYTGEDVHITDSVRVYTITNYGEQCDLACESVVGSMAMECKDGKVWDLDDCFHCEDEDQWISPPDAGDYFNSDWDGEWYCDSKMCVLLDGEIASKQELEDHEDTWVLSDGQYHTTNEDGIMPLEE